MPYKSANEAMVDIGGFAVNPRWLTKRDYKYLTGQQYADLFNEYSMPWQYGYTGSSNAAKDPYASYAFNLSRLKSNLTQAYGRSDDAAVARIQAQLDALKKPDYSQFYSYQPTASWEQSPYFKKWGQNNPYYQHTSQPANQLPLLQTSEYKTKAFEGASGLLPWEVGAMPPGGFTVSKAGGGGGGGTPKYNPRSPSGLFDTGTRGTIGAPTGRSGMPTGMMNSGRNYMQGQVPYSQTPYQQYGQGTPFYGSTNTNNMRNLMSAYNNWGI